MFAYKQMISKNQIKYIRQLELKKYRNSEQCFVAEGPKVIGDLLRHGYKPKMIFATPDYEPAVPLNFEVITAEELQKVSFLQHPQQVIAVFPIPQQPSDIKPKGLLLALDGVQDPGNLGTIIRIADWFGIGTIYCSTDTANVWNPKVVQATMGSIARVNIIYTDLVALLSQTTLPVYGTLLDGQNLYQQELSSEGIIVMGNEGNGISQPVRALVSHRLFIPSYQEGETAESLNVAVATAISCAEFRRRNTI